MSEERYRSVSTPLDAVDVENTGGAVVFMTSALATDIAAEATAATGVCLDIEVPVEDGDQVEALIELLECAFCLSNEFLDCFGIINVLADNYFYRR